MTLIVDGMDQAKTNVPNTKLIAKSTSSLWRLRTHVTGVIIHTHAPCGKLTYSFVDLLQYPHDSNLTLTVITDTLLDFSKKQHLPEVLYLQMDNTTRENKNKYVLTFRAILVQLEIFRKVRTLFHVTLYRHTFKFSCDITYIHYYGTSLISYKLPSICVLLILQVQINFLPVGHIHEDIDQLFSKISETIRHSGCESIPG